MVSDNMSFTDHLPDQFRLCFDKIAYQKESGLDIVFFQRFQDIGRKAVFISCVKGKEDRLLRCIAKINSAILSKLIR